MAKVRFELRCPNVGKVFLVGDFNDWDPSAKRMKRLRKSDPVFVSVLDLKPGRHEFKYIADDEWVCCPNAERVVNEFGTENSVIDVADEE